MSRSTSFALLGCLSGIRLNISCRCLDNIFQNLKLTPRTFALLTSSRNVLHVTNQETVAAIEQLGDTIMELVQRLSSARLNQEGKRLCAITAGAFTASGMEKNENVADMKFETESGFVDEINLLYRIYSRALELYETVSNELETTVTDLDRFVEERAAIPIKVDLPLLYTYKKDTIESMVKSRREEQKVQRMEALRASMLKNPRNKGKNVDEIIQKMMLAEEQDEKKTEMQRRRSSIVTSDLEDDGKEPNELLQDVDDDAFLALDSEEDPYDIHDPLHKEEKDSLLAHFLDNLESHQWPLPEPPQEAPKLKLHDDYLFQFMDMSQKAYERINAFIDDVWHSLACQLIALTCSELLCKKDNFAAAKTAILELGSFLVRSGMSTIHNVLSIEESFLNVNLRNLSFKGIEKGALFSLQRSIIRKMKALNMIFAGLDVYIFPRTMPAHQKGCVTKSIAVSHLDPTYVATGGYDKAIRIWDTLTSTCLAQFIGHQSVVTWCSFNRTDSWIASSSFDGAIKIWDCRKAIELRELSGHEDAVLDCDISHNDLFLVSGSMDCTVRMWSTETGQCLRKFNGHLHWVKQVRFCNDSKRIVSSGMDNKMFVWDIRMNNKTNGAPVYTLAFHLNYVLDLAVLSCRDITLFDDAKYRSTMGISEPTASTKRQRRQDKYANHTDYLISSGKDAAIICWDLMQGRRVKTVVNRKDNDGKAATSIAVSPNKQLLATAVFDNTIRLYEIAIVPKDPQFTLARVLHVHNAGITTVCFPTDHTLAIGTDDGQLQIINV